MLKRTAGLAIVLWCFSFMPALSRDTYPRVAALDAINYTLHLELKDTGDDIRADAEILFAFNDDSVKQIALDFAGLMVDGVTENGQATTFNQAGEHLNVQLRGTYHRGDRCRL